MIIVGLILSVFGIGFFCWLLFTLAVYALPFFVGVTAGIAAFHTGAGVIGALIVGRYRRRRDTRRRTGRLRRCPNRPPSAPRSRSLYAAPAAIAGYHATLGLAQIGVPPKSGARLFAVIGGVVVGGTASLVWRACPALPSHERSVAAISAQPPSSPLAPRRQGLTSIISRLLVGYQAMASDSSA